MRNITEQTIYRLLNTLYKLDVPIAFKGDIVVQADLRKRWARLYTEKNLIKVEADWYGSLHDIGNVPSIIQKALYVVDTSLQVNIVSQDERGYILSIENRENEMRFTIDIRGSLNKEVASTSTKDGKCRFICRTPNTQLAEKISALSTDDGNTAEALYDIYLMSLLTGYTVYGTRCELEYFKVGEYGKLLNHKEQLILEYNKLDNIIGKPDFEEVYKKAISFLDPFIYNTKSNYIWNGSMWI